MDSMYGMYVMIEGVVFIVFSSKGCKGREAVRGGDAIKKARAER